MKGKALPYLGIAFVTLWLSIGFNVWAQSNCDDEIRRTGDAEIDLGFCDDRYDRVLVDPETGELADLTELAFGVDAELRAEPRNALLGQAFVDAIIPFIVFSILFRSGTYLVARKKS